MQKSIYSACEVRFLPKTDKNEEGFYVRLQIKKTLKWIIYGGPFKFKIQAYEVALDLGEKENIPVYL